MSVARSDPKGKKRKVRRVRLEEIPDMGILECRGKTLKEIAANLAVMTRYSVHAMPKPLKPEKCAIPSI